MDPQDYGIPLFSGDDGIALRAAAKKRLVYLDSNIWINIAERAPDVAERCRRAVLAGNVLFPVSTPTVTEVIEQPNSGKASHVAALMDDLSGGISFRPTAVIHAREADLVLLDILGRAVPAVRRKDVLCWITECFCRWTLNFPLSCSRTEAERFTRQTAERPELRSVKWIVDHFPVEKLRTLKSEWDNRYVEHTTESIAQCAARAQHLAKDARWRQHLLEERTWAVKEFVCPRITKNLMEFVGPEKIMGTMAGILQQMGEGGEERLDQIMAIMPSLDLYCHIMVECRRNPARKVCAQDFHDVEHAIVGGVYADVFATSDGRLFDLLTQRCTISASRGCRVVRGVQGLLEALE